MPKPGASSSGGAAAPDEEYMEKDPVLVPPGRWSPRDKCQIYDAVDYMNQRFHLGDHVALHTGGGKEWVCVIEALYSCPSRGVPMFKGRWFWAPEDVCEYQAGRGETMRASKNEAHEMICCDNRDSNPVEVISRKCVILSWPNFAKVRRKVVRVRGPWRSIYFCDRMYYHKAFKFRDLSPALFPGDPIPPDLLAEAGIADVNEMDPAAEAELMDLPGYKIGGQAQKEQKEQKEQEIEVIDVDSLDTEKRINPNIIYI